MKIPVYKQQKTNPQNYNTLFEKPDLSAAKKTAAWGNALGGGLDKLVDYGVEKIGDSVKRKQQALDDIEWGNIEKNTNDQVSKMLEEYKSGMAEQQDMSITKSKFYKDDYDKKVKSMGDTYAKTIKDPLLRQKAAKLWKIMSEQGGGIVEELEDKRTTEIATTMVGSKQANAEMDNDNDGIREAIALKESLGLLKPEEVMPEYEAAHHRKDINNLWEDLKEEDYPTGLKILASEYTEFMSPEEKKELNGRYKEKWGLKNIADKEVREKTEREMQSDFLLQFEQNQLTKEGIFADPRARENPKVVEHFLSKLDARVKAGLSGDKDPNKMTDELIYADAVKVLSDASKTKNEKIAILTSMTGVDKDGMPQVAQAKMLPLIKKAEEDVDIGTKEGLGLISEWFKRERSNESSMSKKSLLDEQESEVVLKYNELLLEGDLDASMKNQVAQNLLDPIKDFNFKSTKVKSGFLDSNLENEAEELQRKIQDNELVGVQYKYSDILKTLRKGQVAFIKTRLKKKKINLGETGEDYNPTTGQMYFANAGIFYRVIVRGKDEVVQKLSREQIWGDL